VRVPAAPGAVIDVAGDYTLRTKADETLHPRGAGFNDSLCTAPTLDGFALVNAEGKPFFQMKDDGSGVKLSIGELGDAFFLFFEVPRGHTEFERDVWLKALEIPRGEVRPYGWVAAEIGRPRAVRAVGSALGHNPVPLIVPCHRVVRSDGAIGQYSLGGPGNKRTILEAEGLDLPRLEQLASSGIRFIGSDTTKIYCLPTCRHARRVTDRHRLEFHSAAEGESRGYRACRVCRPSSAAVAA
jgi:O-6-methylguanine DNA methyltransferase